MFCGHTDTVGVTGMDAPFTPVERDGRLYGRGAQDMKGGVAAMMSAAATVAARGGLASGRLIVAAVVDEEHASIGADALVKTWSADAGVVTEPTDLAIAVGHKGFAWVGSRSRGKRRTAAGPPKGRTILRLGRCRRGSKRWTWRFRHGRRTRFRRIASRVDRVRAGSSAVTLIGQRSNGAAHPPTKSSQ
jgi:acetylornithine deacetylase